MSTSIKSPFSAIVVALSTVILSACGGSSSVVTEPVASFTSSSVSGTVIDLYISGATVTLDDCADVTTTTDSNGKFTFSTTEDCQSSSFTITGGVDTGTGLDFTGELKLKDTNMQDSSELTVTTLTTLEAQLVETNQESLLPTLLENLGISADVDVSNFDYVADTTNSSTTISSRVFVVQQLITKIEDTLELEGVSTEEANSAALSAVIDALAESSIFVEGSETEIDTSIVDSIVSSAVETVTTSNPDITIDDTVITGITESISEVASALDEAISENPNASVQDVLTTTQDTIVANLATPSYSTLSLAGYSLDDLSSSSTSNPIPLSLSSLTDSLTVSFTLDSVNSSTILNDTIGLAFQLDGSRGSTRTESLNVLIPSVNVVYATDGSIESATIPAGTSIAFTSTLAAVQTATFSLANDIEIQASNGSISLSALLSASPTLTNYYNQYIGYLSAGDLAQITAYVAPTNYQISSDLGLSTASITVGSQSLTGKTLTAYFILE